VITNALMVSADYDQNRTRADVVVEHGRISAVVDAGTAPIPTAAATKPCCFAPTIAERHDTGIHTHLLETSKQAELAQARYGTTMVRHLDELGVLSDRWSCAHSIWLTDDDIEPHGRAQSGRRAQSRKQRSARDGIGASPGPARTGRPAGIGD